MVDGRQRLRAGEVAGGEACAEVAREGAERGIRLGNEFGGGHGWQVVGHGSATAGLEGGEFGVLLEPGTPPGEEAGGLPLAGEDGVEVAAVDPEIRGGQGGTGEAGFAGLVRDLVHESEMLLACRGRRWRATVTRDGGQVVIAGRQHDKKKCYQTVNFPSGLKAGSKRRASPLPSWPA